MTSATYGLGSQEKLERLFGNFDDRDRGFTGCIYTLMLRKKRAQCFLPCGDDSSGCSGHLPKLSSAEASAEHQTGNWEAVLVTVALM